MMSIAKMGHWVNESSQFFNLSHMWILRRPS
ncbi:hypothetical protein RUA4292_04457 [Ruegeria atlantica]|uniref:Uncharacterized protein n=1 Tax=Ruegeria atlantica TaxID=81569 RepID=A0A0P1EIE7_9RHOB|nr:hypothetical protein RUA4292_04457 [Ruegeria atlantica]